jgi:hypothetical protein
MPAALTGVETGEKSQPIRRQLKVAEGWGPGKSC